MNIQINHTDWKQAIGVVTSVINKKGHWDSATWIKIEAIGDDIYMSATNLETSVRIHVPGLVIEEGTVWVVSTLISKANGTKKYPCVDITVNDGKVVVLANGLRMELPAQDAEKAADMEFESKADTIIIEDTIAFTCAIDTGVMHAAKEDNRPILQGIELSSENNLFTAIAADGFRLSKCTWAANYENIPTFRVIIPATALKLMSKVGFSRNFRVLLQIEESHVHFTLGDTQFIVQRIEGKYPDVAQIIPGPSLYHGYGSIEDCLPVVAKIANMIKRPYWEADNGVRLHPEGLAWVWTSSKADLVFESHWPVYYKQGFDFRPNMSFNIRYVHDALVAMQGAGGFYMDTSDGSSPIKFSASIGRLLTTIVVMPMTLGYNDKDNTNSSDPLPEGMKDLLNWQTVSSWRTQLKTWQDTIMCDLVEREIDLNELVEGTNIFGYDLPNNLYPEHGKLFWTRAQAIKLTWIDKAVSA